MTEDQRLSNTEIDTLFARLEIVASILRRRYDCGEPVDCRDAAIIDLCDIIRNLARRVAELEARAAGGQPGEPTRPSDR